ncbi:MAG TPA: osmoprotectant NAGGN system M42 family peptidase, partial [Rhodospirillaceae bacterium]|nr:osmoprotectant NAGGN system M42 family peptidase [Rhodospirillaceae bacterium]
MTKLEIDTDYLRTQLQQLLDIASPTGFTDNVVREVCDELSRLGVDFELTRRGAIRARMPGVDKQPARAFVSHLDTLG